MKAVILWSVLVMSVCAASALAGNTDLVGTNPKGDTIEWQDGSIWKNVTVSTFKIQKKDGTNTPVIEIADVPAGKSAGTFSNWVSVNLRGESKPSAVPKDVPSVVDLSKMYSTKSLKGIPALQSEFADTYISDIPADWEQSTFKPEFSAIGTDKEGNKILIRFKVTITNLLRQDGRVVALIRKTKSGGATTPENYFTGFKTIYFAREVEK
ncbi:MAG: hypothetical protein BWK76_28315 [Desulfobulbaceae bacterium A2]|nr:MAG: hypothetical protein BWK76_28315 [Desulfobulbaceae bacterium A2]